MTEPPALVMARPLASELERDSDQSVEWPGPVGRPELEPVGQS